MPIEYERDDVRRRVLVRIAGAFEAAEVLALFDRPQLEGAGGYAVLYDLRETSGLPSTSDLRGVITRGVADQSRGPLAIVVTDRGMYLKVSTYAALARAVLDIRVFRELEDADRWLAEAQRLA